ncbi:HD domain-containing protein [Kribbella catacumbae]|uniref:HD domain-containing protein n=1 Tax=Kribbella catacumbae TaxID=460086 RepID=UPI0012FA45A5|nr:HD domain-containing protein [Kribbella catacumbae]
MLPLLTPTRNDYGYDVTGLVPGWESVLGAGDLGSEQQAIWDRAVGYLKVRSNDVHTIYSYGIAQALADLHPEAHPEVVLPAILLHDIGWSQAPEGEILDAIAPGGDRRDLIVLHEKEGARLARGILQELGVEPSRVEAILAIIDGHDTRREAISLDDALVKDADKLWRLTPHGIDTVMGWFGLTRDEAHRLIGSRVHHHLLTDAGRTMARALAAVAWVDSSPQRVALG